MANRFGIKECLDVIFYNLSTGKPELFFDTLKVTTLESAAETTYASGGRGNPRLIGWDFSRTPTLSMEDALLSQESLASLNGNAVSTGAVEIHNREYLTTVTTATTGKTSKVTLANTIVASSVVAYQTTDGIIHGTEVTAFTATGAVVEFDSLAVGSKVIVYYKYNSASTAKTIKITSDKFPSHYKIVGDTLVRGEDGIDEKYQIVVPKAKLQPNFTFTLDAENPSVFSFNLDIFKDANSKDMVQFIKY